MIISRLFKRHAISALLAGATALAAPVAVQAQQNVLKVVMHSDLKIVDPIWTTAYITRNHGYMIYDTLFAMDAKGDIKPQMVEKYSVSPDNLTWTFTLREGVKFQDGTPLDADAVVYTFERQRDPKHEAHGDGEYVYWHDQFSGVAKAEVAGPGKVKFTLERPFTPFLSNMAMFTAFIISPTAMKKSLGQKPAPVPVGTGPFQLLGGRRSESVVLEANPDYWGGRPHLDRLVFRTIPDNNTPLMSLQKGELQGVEAGEVTRRGGLRAGRHARARRREGPPRS